MYIYIYIYTHEHIYTKNKQPGSCPAARPRERGARRPCASGLAPRWRLPPHVYIHVCMYVYMCMCIYIYIYIYTCMYVYIHIYIYIYTFAHTHIYICMYIYIYIYTRIHMNHLLFCHGCPVRFERFPFRRFGTTFVLSCFTLSILSSRRLAA